MRMLQMGFCSWLQPFVVISSYLNASIYTKRSSTKVIKGCSVQVFATPLYMIYTGGWRTLQIDVATDQLRQRRLIGYNCCFVLYGADRSAF